MVKRGSEIEAIFSLDLRPLASELRIALRRRSRFHRAGGSREREAIDGGTL
jgi:hypothetical protein